MQRALLSQGWVRAVVKDEVELLELNGRRDYEACVATITKLLGNVLASPDEPKFRKIRTSNAAFAAKVYSCKGAPELLALAGFDDAPESGHLVLPAGADLAPLQHALDLLKAQAAGRTEAEEKKRKAEERAKHSNSENLSKDTLRMASTGWAHMKRATKITGQAALALKASLWVDDETENANLER